MKKGVYIISDRVYSSTDEGNGIYKKINSQIKAFTELGCECTLLNLPFPKGNFFSTFIRYNRKKVYPKIDFSGIDFVYIRRIVPNNRSFNFLLYKMKKENPEMKIIYEIPTYPYDSELKGFRGKVVLFIDKWYRKRLNRYIDFITTYGDYKSIFNIPVLTIVNGIDCASISLKNKENLTADIHAIVVAQYWFWHGYDRLIEGMKDYYSSPRDKKFYVNFVGEGPELSRYKALVNKYQLDSYVKFSGKLSGSDLDRAFYDADIAFCSLGAHRKKLYLSSELKSREYMARGLPIVSSVSIDVIPNDYKYWLKFAEDDSNICIDDIISFCGKIYKNETKKEVSLAIREFVEKKCDMKIVVKSIVDKIFQ